MSPPLHPPPDMEFSGSRTQDMMMEERKTAWMGTVARIILRQNPRRGGGTGVAGSASQTEAVGLSWIEVEVVVNWSSSVHVPRVTLSSLEWK